MTAGEGAAAPLPAFDPHGALPTGTALLEASAGTGKTYAVAGLTARYVAEAQVPLTDLLVVTFGRTATGEVRERVRDRLATGAQALADGTGAGDPYLAALARAPRGEVLARSERLRRAVSQFDAATILTTHQFCSRVLAGLGLAGGSDPRTTLAERSGELVAEAIVEVYLRDVAADPGLRRVLPFAAAREVARAAVADAQATLMPSGEVDDLAARARVRFAAAVRGEVVERRRARLEADYDDLLVQVRDALSDPVAGPATARRLRRRYRVVLVDEFQDTDPLQWQILRLAFHGHVPLVLVGDPKQAIYAFRGGDLHTYLKAADAASTSATLAVNWRADPAMVCGVQRLLAGAALGDPRVAVHRVEAGLAGARLEGPASPVRLRVLTTADAPCDRTGRRLTVGGARPAVARDVAAVTVGLLAGTARYHAPDGARRLRPGDLAVLVRTNKQADLVRDHLAAAGVPAVLSGARSVFRTEAAQAWLTLLRALEEPHRLSLVHAAALTMLVGTPPRLLAASDDQTGGEPDELGRRLRAWREEWTVRGVPALVEQVVEAGLMSRLLATPTGERDLTDVRHVAEALHHAAVHDRLGPTAQREWLAAQVADADAETGDRAVERSRRLDSDRDAVQVLTVHAAKGLEFPVVLVPFGWDRFVPRRPPTLLLHGRDGERRLHVGGPSSPDYDVSRRQAEAEDANEELRALYVALTRAASHLVLWWAPATTTETAPLHRLLFGRFAAGQVPPEVVDVPSDRDVHALLTARAEPGLLEVQRATPGATTTWSAAGPAATLDGVARFDRPLDLRWGRLSYTSLTAGQGHGTDGPQDAVEPEDPGLQDEPADATTPVAPGADGSGAGVDADEARLACLPSAWDALPAGASFGTLVHAVLEQVDPGTRDLGGHVRAVCEQQVSRRPGSSADPAALAAAVLAALHAPLGRLAGDRRLLDVPAADRLAELSFELPLAGGERADRRRATVAELAGLLRRHLPADDPLAAYPEQLAAQGLGDRPLGGYLVGSIDAVLRLPSEPGRPRYAVVDYKTNLVPTDGEPLTAWHYRPDVLAPLMARAHYPLQALLYSVALHRLLRWRQPDYDPAVHLGGVLYLFVRGMVGPEALDRRGRPCGVFAWEPPAPLVVEASALLAGGSR